jgi:hypothetical protein
LQQLSEMKGSFLNDDLSDEEQNDHDQDHHDLSGPLGSLRTVSYDSVDKAVDHLHTQPYLQHNNNNSNAHLQYLPQYNQLQTTHPSDSYPIHQSSTQSLLPGVNTNHNNSNNNNNNSNSVSWNHLDYLVNSALELSPLGGGTYPPTQSASSTSNFPTGSYYSNHNTGSNHNLSSNPVVPGSSSSSGLLPFHSSPTHSLLAQQPSLTLNNLSNAHDDQLDNNGSNNSSFLLHHPTFHNDLNDLHKLLSDDHHHQLHHQRNNNHNNNDNNNIINSSNNSSSHLLHEPLFFSASGIIPTSGNGNGNGNHNNSLHSDNHHRKRSKSSEGTSQVRLSSDSNLNDSNEQEINVDDLDDDEDDDEFDDDENEMDEDDQEDDHGIIGDPILALANRYSSPTTPKSRK